MGLEVIHESQGSVFPLRAWFTGSTALAEGQGVCFERDFVSTSTPATAGSGRRDKRVELPNSDNNMAFAGVTVKAYDAVSGGQWVELYKPGSACEVFCPIATTVGATKLTAGVGSGLAGLFALAGVAGRGSALALQSQANVANTVDIGPLAASLDGSFTWASATRRLTKAGSAAFTYAAAGDKVIILAGMNDSGANPYTPGTYIVSAKIDNDTIELSTAPAGVDCRMVFVAYRGSPTILAKLLDGPESGLVEVLAITTGGTPAAMPGGRSYLYARCSGGLAADATITIADAPRDVERKDFVEWGTIAVGGGQKDIVITPTASNIIRPTHAALVTFKMHTSGDNATLVWNGQSWLLQGKGTAA